MHSGFNILKPWPFAHVSIANTSLMSVAVVTTGIAFNISAIWIANSLAPPICPDRTGIENCPSSSTTTTAGSFTLDWTYGEIALMAMPIAPTKTRASLVEKCSSVHWDNPPLAHRLNSTPSRDSFSLAAISMPLSVNAIIDIFIFILRVN